MNTTKLIYNNLKNFELDEENENDYMPTKKVFSLVKYLLQVCEEHHVIPTRVAISIIGGVGITFRKNKEEKDYIEIRNESGISHLHSIYMDDTLKVLEVQDIVPEQFSDIIKAIKNRNNEVT